MSSNLEARNASPCRRGALKAQSWNHGCHGVPHSLRPNSAIPSSLQVVAAQPFRETPRLDRLVVIAGDEHDLLRRDSSEPLLEGAGEKRVLAPHVTFERERDIAGDEQQVARRDVDEVLVKIRDADNPGHALPS